MCFLKNSTPTYEDHRHEKVCMLARQIGFPLPIKVTWNSEKLWKECGLGGGPGYDS
jgi:hypothetical protein